MEQDPGQAKQGSAASNAGQFKKGESGNPAGRPSKRTRREVRADGYVNAFTGHGTSRDRRSFTTHRTLVINDLTAIDLRRGNWLAARICELLPADAFRRGYTLKLDKKEKAEKTQTAIEELRLNEHVMQAWQMERTCGGAAIFPVLDGALGDISTPLELVKGEPRIGKVLALHLFEPRELVPETWYSDVTHPKFRMPQTYRLWPLSGGRGTTTMQTVHESRLAIFPGVRVTSEQLPGSRLGWGDSALNRTAEVMSDFGLSWGSAATILHNFSQRVIKFAGLVEMLKEEGGEAVVQRRAAVMDMIANALRALPLDKDDDLVNVSTSVAGFAELLIQFAQLISAAADMPMTRLFGMSPAGMNATGEHDMAGWYDRVGNGQTYVTPQVEWLIKLLLLSADGPTQGSEPDVWSIEWNPLWSPSEKEDAETRKTVAETDKIYYDIGAASPDDIATSRWKGDSYSAEMNIDWKAREAQKKIDEEREVELDAAAVEAMGRRSASVPGEVPPIEDVDKEAVKPPARTERAA